MITVKTREQSIRRMSKYGDPDHSGVYVARRPRSHVYPYETETLLELVLAAGVDFAESSLVHSVALRWDRFFRLTMTDGIKIELADLGSSPSFRSFAHPA